MNSLGGAILFFPPHLGPFRRWELCFSGNLTSSTSPRGFGRHMPCNRGASLCSVGLGDIAYLGACLAA